MQPQGTDGVLAIYSMVFRSPPGRARLLVVDEEAALLARRVAMAASAWLNAPTDVEAYRRLTQAVEEWNAYSAPRMVDGTDELLDELADTSPPVLLGEAVPDLERTLRAVARREM